MDSEVDVQIKSALHHNIEEIRNGQIRRVESEKSEFYKELIETIALSFAGTETTAPEAISDWVYCGNTRKGKHTQPLAEAPTKDRIKVFRWTAKYLAMAALEQGGCFVMVEPGTNRVVGAALSFPPAHNANNDSIVISILRAILKFGVPRLSWEAIRRAMVMFEGLHLLHDAAVREKHWYILNLAIKSQEQGKGYGKQFLRFFNKLADVDGAKLYLETVGARNIAVYSKAGYKIHSRIVLKSREDILDDDGGVTAMVRQPKCL